MNDHTRDQQWMAYLDDELGAKDAAEFDAQLSEAQRARLLAEKRLESGMTERLSAGPGCPEALWRRTELLVRNAAPVSRRKRLVYALAYAAAAGLAVALAIGALWLPGPQAEVPGYLLMNAATVSALAAESSVAPEDVPELLASRGIPLSVRSAGELPGHHHAMTLLGARTARAGDTETVELLYECCQRPVKVLLAPADSPVAARMTAAVNTPLESIAYAARDRELGAKGSGVFDVGYFGVQRVADFDGYVAGVIGLHRAPEVLGLLAPVQQQARATGSVSL